MVPWLHQWGGTTRSQENEEPYVAGLRGTARVSRTVIEKVSCSVGKGRYLKKKKKTTHHNAPGEKSQLGCPRTQRIAVTAHRITRWDYSAFPPSPCLPPISEEARNHSQKQGRSYRGGEVRKSIWPLLLVPNFRPDWSQLWREAELKVTWIGLCTALDVFLLWEKDLFFRYYLLVIRTANGELPRVVMVSGTWELGLNSQNSRFEGTGAKLRLLFMSHLPSPSHAINKFNMNT